MEIINKMLYKQFYSELGKLLYAVANIDGVITQKEKTALQDIVKKELVPAEKHTDIFGTDSGYYTEIEFDFLDEQIVDPEAAFESFIGFIEDHYHAFDENMKKLCVYVAEKLAAAYHGANHKEKSLIEKLKYKLVQMELKDLKTLEKKNKI